MSYPDQPPPRYQAKDGYQSIPQYEPATPSEIPFEQHQRSESAVHPDDLMYGVTVQQSSPQVRAIFLSKVYTTLFLQILGTTVFAAIMTTKGVAGWFQQNQWAFLLPLFGSFITLGFLYWKRHAHPTNLILLGLFTLLESISLGSVITYIDQKIVLQAMVITTFTFLGLSLFTLQSKWDFSSLGGWLFGALLILVSTSFVGFFFPYSHAFDMLTAAAGCLIFSLYIVYDTWLIQRRLHADEWVMANVSLYLDILNLFISILRILNGTQDD